MQNLYQCVQAASTRFLERLVNFAEAAHGQRQRTHSEPFRSAYHEMMERTALLLRTEKPERLIVLPRTSSFSD